MHMLDDNSKLPFDSSWSAEESTDNLTEEERIAQAEHEAEENYDERREHERESLARQKWDREHPDSRQDHDWYGEEKKDETINGQRTKSHRLFSDPGSRIFNRSGKSNLFRTAETKRRISRYLGRELRSTVSSANRDTYLDVLDNFKDMRTGVLSKQDVREANRVIRTGEAGNRQSTKRAIEMMRQKGLINSAKDLKTIVRRSAVRQINDLLLRPQDGEPVRRPSREENSRSSELNHGAPPTRGR